MNLDTLETASPPESISQTPRDPDLAFKKEPSNLADIAFKRGPSLEHAAHATMPGEKVREHMEIDSLSEIEGGSAPDIASLSMSEEDPTAKKVPQDKMLIKEKPDSKAAQGSTNQQNKKPGTV